MLRLADRIMLGTSVYCQDDVDVVQPIINDVATNLKDGVAKIIIANNVYNFLHATCADNNVLHSYQQCSGKMSCNPCFIEWDITHEQEIAEPGIRPQQIGVYCINLPKNDNGTYPIAAIIFYFYQNNIYYGGGFVIMLDSEGNILGINTPKQLRYSHAIPAIVAHTLAFMNCKNVVIQDDTHEYAQPAKWYRRTKVPQVTYHTINIQPRTVRHNPNPISTGIQQRLHICRGHFMHYKEDGPGMFGRGVYGRFWVPQHPRGSQELGIINARYNVSPPDFEGVKYD